MWFSCTRALRLREPIDSWIRAQHGQYANPIEINHWEYMEDMLPVLACIKKASKRLEADNVPTGLKSLKVFLQLRGVLISLVRDTECKNTGTAIIPFCKDLVQKFDEIVDDPTLIWQMAFLALMDPSGGVT